MIFNIIFHRLWILRCKPELDSPSYSHDYVGNAEDISESQGIKTLSKLNVNDEKSTKFSEWNA